jgi:hypothetical protein
MLSPLGYSPYFKKRKSTTSIQRKRSGKDSRKEWQRDGEQEALTRASEDKKEKKQQMIVTQVLAKIHRTIRQNKLILLCCHFKNKSNKIGQQKSLYDSTYQQRKPLLTL